MKISVCLATFNGEKYLQQQIESILIQLGDNDELIISDDGSSDQTLNIIESFSDKRIHIFHNKMNHGFIGNFENALRIATGDYIFLSDQDDVWSSDKLRISLQALEKADLIVHDAEMIDGMGNSLGKNYYSMMHSGTGFLRNWLYTRFLGCCMAFNRKVLNACLPFPKYITGHDYWIGMYWLFKYHRSVYFSEEVLMCYRRHGGNVSTSSEKSNNSFFYKILTKRFFLLEAVIKRFIKTQFEY